MIKKLQIKLIVITMGVLVLVFVIVFATLNLFMRFSNNQQTEDFLQMVVDNDGLVETFGKNKKPENAPPQAGDPSPPPHGKQMFRFFYVKLDHVGNVSEVKISMGFDFTDDEALAYVETAEKSTREKGHIDNYQYLISPTEYGKILVFAEQSIELQMLSRLTQLSLVVAAISCLLLFGLSVFLSKWAVAPVKDAFERQRQFVSDASHELKTPLTIINANTDVLAHEIGENARLAGIKVQTDRMNHLIHDMLTLAKTDEGALQIIMSPFDLSTMVQNTLLEFESRAFEEHKRFTYDIQKGISFTGNEDQLKQTTSILVDNALRYSPLDGKISVDLKQKGDKLLLSVYNTGEGLSKQEQELLFERFYRSDQSRSRETGGYGLGLSIAKAIVESHKGKIMVESKKNEWTRFVVSLPVAP